jgi:hypothetical protein
MCPTRERPELLRQFLDSLKANMDFPERIEVVLGIDADDRVSLDFTYPWFNLTKTVFPPGTPIGRMHQLCYEASAGDYVIIVNDDVILRLKNWDAVFLQVAKGFSDQIFLLHSDDGTFGRSLCTMPFVSRRFCELAGGLLPDIYTRYRGDDHITNIFYLLELIGFRRWIYLDQVVFEHLNYSEDGEAGRVYGFKDAAIEEADQAQFLESHAARKETVLRLADAIEPKADHETRARWRAILDQVPPMNHQIAYNEFQHHGRFGPEGFTFHDEPVDANR